MEIPIAISRPSPWSRVRDLAGPVVTWSVWAFFTVVLILFVRQYTRNVPYKDDIAMVAVMTGAQKVDLTWLWAQHNEHRPLLSRLILAGLTRYVVSDFRMGLYLNASMLSAAAAGMLLVVRKLRGSTSVTDSVIPMAILTMSQTETMTIGFALNLILTAWVSYGLIAMVSLAGRRPPGAPAVGVGLAVFLLPLIGGSGLVMLPPLVLWLIGYVCWGWWSGKEVGGGARAFVVVLLMATASIVALYLSGYARPSYHPPAPSMTAAASTTIECLSTIIYPNVGPYFFTTGLVVVFFSVVTVVRLAIVGLRMPAERPKALGLIAIIASMLGTAAAVGLSRSGLGPGAGLADRYVTIMTPLLCTLYIAWLLYAPPLRRQSFFVVLLAAVGLLIPINFHKAMDRGRAVRTIVRRVERSIQAGMPVDVVAAQACPLLFPGKDYLRDCFVMLKTARIGHFTDLVVEPATGVAAGPTGVRR